MLFTVCTIQFKLSSFHKKNYHCIRFYPITFSYYGCGEQKLDITHGSHALHSQPSDYSLTLMVKSL